MRPPRSHRAGGSPRTSGLPLLRPLERLLGWGDRGPWREVAVRAIAFAVGAAALFAVVAVWDWSHVRGWPQEQARIVDLVATGDTDSCGRSSHDVYQRTWVSEAPPAGLPARFTDEEACDVGSVGDVESVVRVVHDDGSVHVWVDPATSLAEMAVVTGGGLVLGYLVGVVFGVIVLVRRRIRRTPAPATPRENRL